MRDSAEWQTGMTNNGFRVVNITELPALSIRALELIHDNSGARMLHLEADDQENLFAAAFRTPPPDDTGLPHILEHTVLCGSKRYPVKDPFVELLKCSLATFLNAFTYPDRTIYPCASMNHKDFRNLMRVYCDAVFNPLITQDHFRQEGHHLEPNPESASGLLVKGIVYNEMRGAYSDPDEMMERRLFRMLYDGNAYSRDFGGDPAAIQTLTYDQFVAFHKTYYHPANAWFFTYGNADLHETLRILDEEFLVGCKRINVDSTIAALPRWSKPRTMRVPFPLDEAESDGGKSQVAIAFAANDLREVTTSLAMNLLDTYFLDNAASPLRKSLIDSKLGEEVGPSGYVSWLRDTAFSVSLKGTEPDRADAIEEVVFQTIRKEIATGFDRERIDAALHQLELASREIPTQYPLRLMERAYSSWLYDSDPLAHIRLGEKLDELRKVLDSQPRYLEDLAQRVFIDNQHRAMVIMVPDKVYVERQDQEQEDRLLALREKMSVADLEQVAVEADRLEKMQSEGNSPDNLATLPRLSIKDVSPEPLPFDYVKTMAEPLLLHVQPPSGTGGVGYLQLWLDISGLGDEDLDDLPLLCEAMSKMGAAGNDYAVMADREAAVTGGLDIGCGTAVHIEGPSAARLRMSFTLRALEKNWEKALGVLHDRLFAPEYSDRERLADVIKQLRMSWRSQIVGAGNQYAVSRAGRHISPVVAMAERLAGCHQARLINRLASDVENKSVDAVVDKLQRLQSLIVGNGGPAAAFAGNDKAGMLTRQWLHDTSKKLGGVYGKKDFRFSTHLLGEEGRREGLAVPADVAFVAKVIPAPALIHPDAPALMLLSQQLSYGYLWNELRVKGGAYGARAAYDGARGVFSLSSFRDPNVSRSLAAYGGVVAYVENEMDLTQAGVEQAIIGAIKGLDAPIRPTIMSGLALTRHLSGEGDAFRKEFRARLLSLTGDAIRKACRIHMGSAAINPAYCVLTSRERLQSENSLMKGDEFTVEPLWNT